MKNTYYVSIQAMKIMEHKGDAAYEFEIIASPEEVEALKEIITHMANADHASYWIGHIPYIPYHLDKENDQYDRSLIDAYQMIYDLGTDETKNHITSMNILY